MLPYFQYSLRVFLFLILLSVWIQAHFIYQPHIPFLATVSPETIDSKEEFLDLLPTMADNQLVRFNFKSIEQTAMKKVEGEETLIGWIDREDRGYYFYGVMDDGVFLLLSGQENLTETQILAAVDFGSSGAELDDALYLAGTRELFLPASELADQLAHFTLVQQSSTELIKLFCLYLLLLWILPIAYFVYDFRRLSLGPLIKLNSDTPKGRSLVFLAGLGMIAVNVLAYTQLKDINSFTSDSWRRPDREQEGFTFILGLLEDDLPMEEVIQAHEQFLKENLVEEIHSPLKVGRRVNKQDEPSLTEDKQSKEVVALIVTRDNQEKLVFSCSDEEVNALYQHGYWASWLCLQRQRRTVPEQPEHLEMLQSVRDKRDALAESVNKVRSWQTRNKITTINDEIQAVADCSQKKIHWVFGQKYYYSQQMDALYERMQQKITGEKDEKQ